MKNYKHNSHKHNKGEGFSLVEALVAIAILLVAVVGPISLIGDSLHKVYFAKDEMIAINLAQEGIDVVRRVRDNNMLSGNSWDSGITEGSYYIDTFSDTPIGSCADSKVYLDTNGYKQCIPGGTATQFSREVQIANVGSSGKEKKITSTVTWRTGGDTGTVSVSGYIFNWTL